MYSTEWSWIITLHILSSKINMHCLFVNNSRGDSSLHDCHGYLPFMAALHKFPISLFGDELRKNWPRIYLVTKPKLWVAFNNDENSMAHWSHRHLFNKKQNAEQ